MLHQIEISEHHGFYEVWFLQPFERHIELRRGNRKEKRPLPADINSTNDGTTGVLDDDEWRRIGQRLSLFNADAPRHWIRCRPQNDTNVYVLTNEYRAGLSGQLAPLRAQLNVPRFAQR